MRDVSLIRPEQISYKFTKPSPSYQMKYSLKMAIFWDVVLGSLAEIDRRRFRGVYYHHHLTDD